MKPNSIKQIVIEEVKKLNGEFPSKEHLEQLVKEYFPDSKWKDTHYYWYKSQIKRGLIVIDEPTSGSMNLFEPEENAKEISRSLEKDLHSYLSLRLDKLEIDLELVDNGIEYKTSAGFIDILAKDKNGNYVVIELKAGKAKDAVIGQILGYIGALSVELNIQNVRGIIVASDFEDRLLYAINNIPNLQLVRYGLTFSFTEEVL